VLSFTLWVTDSLGMICDQPDTVTITVTDRTVAGLTASNDSPTGAGQPVNFTAAITQGTNVSYTWAFGDGAAGVGRTPDHAYTAVGTYTAVVTASNSVSVLTATTTVSVTAPVTRYTYLPLVLNNYAAAPDLVVERIEATESDVQVVVRNLGDAPATEDFWVDVYVDPAPAPTAVNQTWSHLSDQGLVWGVTVDLGVGEALTLTHGGLYYRPAESEITWPLAVGTPIYAQVDSANADTTYGAVLENHEITGGAYNNVTQTTVAADDGEGAVDVPKPAHLLPRW
jgi:PKD repeat protein